MKTGININRPIQLLLFFMFVVNTASALWGPLFSVFILKSIAGATLAFVGITSALYGLSKCFFQIIVAKKIDEHRGENDDFRALLSGIILASVCSFSLILIDQMWQLGVLQIMWGIADALTMAAYYALFSHHLDKKQAGLEWSLFSVGGVTLAGAIGGAAGGFAIQAFGFSWVFFAAGSLNLISLVILLILYPHIKKISSLKVSN